MNPLTDRIVKHLFIASWTLAGYVAIFNPLPAFGETRACSMVRELIEYHVSVAASYHEANSPVSASAHLRKAAEIQRANGCQGTTYEYESSPRLLETVGTTYEPVLPSARDLIWGADDEACLAATDVAIADAKVRMAAAGEFYWPMFFVTPVGCNRNFD